MDRFFRSAAALEIEMPLTKDALKSLLQELVKKMDDDELFAYYSVTRGGALRQFCFQPEKANLLVTLTPRKVNDGKIAVKLITTEDTRHLHCDVKTLNILPSVMASERAKRAGAHESVYYRAGGRVTEGAHSNVHIIRGGTLITAPLDNLILPGIARAHLLAACKRLGIPVEERPYMLNELFAADEVLVTSSSNLCLHAYEIDGRPVGNRLPELYESIRAEIIGEYLRETE